MSKPAVAAASVAKTDKEKDKIRLKGSERETFLAPLKTTGWTEVSNRDAIYKEFVFKTFNQAWRFMSGAALQAERMDHYPEWFNDEKKVQVTLTSTDCDGLSQRDMRLAAFMDKVAKTMQQK